MFWPQAALLAEVVQAPTAYDPLTYPARSLARERHLIARLVVVGALTQAQAESHLAVRLPKMLAGAGGNCRS
jgi:membrane peptidoglycan carboxypeptidase